MVSYIRTHNNGTLTKKDEGSKVTLVGWVHKRRDHGGVIFIDLRDRFGITQVLFNPKIDEQVHDKAKDLRSEWVISIKGKVVPRGEGMTNPKLKTGEIEIEAHEIEILSKAKTPPFTIADESPVNEELRLKYRYLDIRRGEVANRLVMRHKLMQATRNLLSDEGFCEITTPVLGKSTPEGARDFLVPSRNFPGTFYALPQSPQLFKQLLMIGGMDRYFQIATCFRDEDLRADRQPEFSQIDIEMSFGTYEELFPIIEKLVVKLFEASLGMEIYPPFQRMTYQEAVETYGTDKPDLRFELPLHRVTDIIKEASFPHFQEVIGKGGIVKCLVVKKGNTLSRRNIEAFGPFVQKFGVDNVFWLKVGETSGIAKFFDDKLLKKLQDKVEAEKEDLILFLAGKEKSVNQAGDHLRRHIGEELNLIEKNRFALLWVTDFPLFQWDEETQNYACEHHPFTSPHKEDFALLDVDPLKVRSSSYDLVLNGYEIASGSERIFNSDLQAKIFQLIKLSEEEIVERFGFFIEALKYGTPPHLGIALGFDRLVMIFTHGESIRDVIAFPKTQKGNDLMLEAPSSVMKQQLTELKIHVEP